MNRKLTPVNFDEEVLFCLKSQIIPMWERYGMEHLAVSAETLSEFRKQSSAEIIKSREKKRKTRRPIKYRRRIKSAGTVESWPDDDLHSVRFPSLVYIRSGQADMQVADYVAHLPEGCFILLRPEVPRPAGETLMLEKPYQGKSYELWRFNGFNDYVTLSVSYSVGEQHANSGQYYIVSDPHTVQIFHMFAEESMQQGLHYQQTAFSLLRTFFYLFYREVKEERFHNRGVNDLFQAELKMDSPIEMACRYIHKNLNHSLTIDTVAQAVFMSRTNFVRQFKEETGKTFNEYLTEHRLEEAKHWLARETFSIEAVGAFVGLKHSRFHQLFRQRFGMTPAEFRRKQKHENTSS